jgi:AraC family transcriptional regulator
MEPSIRTIAGKTLIGKRLRMSLADNRTAELWRSFMPVRKQISYTAGPDLYSIQFYSEDYFTAFSPLREFEKWAAIEVTAIDTIPDGMEKVELPGGKYAVFAYKGSGNDPTIFQYIFTSWLPQSAYRLDNRPHFELLGEKYKNDDPDSEEEIWIPVTARG